MDNNLFNETVKKVCSSVTGKQKKSEIEEELLCHLEDTYERNIAMGKNDEEAEKEAIAALGDLNILRDRLGKLHSFSHAGAVAGSIYLFIAAFLLLKINIFQNYADIIRFAASIMMLLSMARLRTADKNFCFAFLSEWLFVLLTAIFSGLSVFFNSTALKMTVSAVMCVTVSAVWYFSFAGFRSLYKRFCDTENKKVNLTFPMLMLSLGNLINGIILLLNRGEEINFESVIIGGIVILFYIYCIVQLIRLHNRLWDADAQYGVSPWGKAPVGKVLFITLLGILLPLSCQLASATSTPKTEELIIHDTDGDETAVREKMKALGFPAAYLDELPDSEVKNYKDAKYMTSTTSSVCDMDAECFHFYIYNGEYDNEEMVTDIPRIRTIVRIRTNGNEMKKLYKCGLYIDMSQYQNNYAILPFNPSEWFMQVNSKENGKITVQQPAKITKPEDNQYSLDGIYGGEFRFTPNQAVYFAITNNIRTTELSFYANLIFIAAEQTRPFTLRYPNLTSFVQTNRLIMPNDFCMSNDILYTEIHYEPEYLGIEAGNS